VLSSKNNCLVMTMTWIRNHKLEDLQAVGHKEQDGKTYTYLAKRLENGVVAWACVVQDGDQERVVERGLIPPAVAGWIDAGPRAV